jgi:hypothetical protein
MLEDGASSQPSGSGMSFEQHVGRTASMPVMVAGALLPGSGAAAIPIAIAGTVGASGRMRPATLHSGANVQTAMAAQGQAHGLPPYHRDRPVAQSMDHYFIQQHMVQQAHMASPARSPAPDAHYAHHSEGGGTPLTGPLQTAPLSMGSGPNGLGSGESGAGLRQHTPATPPRPLLGFAAPVAEAAQWRATAAAPSPSSAAPVPVPAHERSSPAAMLGGGGTAPAFRHSRTEPLLYGAFGTAPAAVAVHIYDGCHSADEGARRAERPAADAGGGSSQTTSTSCDAGADAGHGCEHELLAAMGAAHGAELEGCSFASPARAAFTLDRAADSAPQGLPSGPLSTAAGAASPRAVAAGAAAPAGWPHAEAAAHSWHGGAGFGQLPFTAEEVEAKDEPGSEAAEDEGRGVGGGPYGAVLHRGRLLHAGLGAEPSEYMAEDADSDEGAASHEQVRGC